MKKIIFLITATLLSASIYAVNMGSIVKAQVILGQVGQVIDKYQEVQALLDNGTITLDYAEPIEGNTGKFLLPFDEAGNPTLWAEKALSAQIGAAVSEKVSGKAIDTALSKVPFGGFMRGAAKSKAKGAGAILAIGGWDYIKETTTLSFNRLDDYSIYLHSEYNGLPGYETALAAAMAVYPKLETAHRKYIDKAYKKARKEARKQGF